MQLLFCRGGLLFQLFGPPPLCHLTLIDTLLRDVHEPPGPHVRAVPAAHGERVGAAAMEAVPEEVQGNRFKDVNLEKKRWQRSLVARNYPKLELNIHAYVLQWGEKFDQRYIDKHFDNKKKVIAKSIIIH